MVDFQNTIVGVLSEYSQVFSRNLTVPNFIICDDMRLQYGELVPEFKKENPEAYNTINVYNALTVPPTSIDGKYTVLLRKEYVLSCYKNNYPNLIGTVAHETTHVLDYVDYSKLMGIVNCQDVLRIDEHAMFNLWTEFNARSRGYYFVRKYTFENMFDRSQITNIVNYELPAQDRILYENISKYDGYMRAYCVASYLGRLYSLQTIFPHYFTDNYISNMNVLKDNTWILDWFIYLKNHSEINKAYTTFDEMKAILQQHFSGLN